MVPKVFVAADGLATFVCPECQKAARKDVKKFMGLNHAVRFRAKCPCGHHYSVDLERRKHCRAAVNLPGVVFRAPGVDDNDRMPMVVRDLSPQGIRFRVSRLGRFASGDRCRVEFLLDDAARSSIQKEILVTLVSGHDVGGKYIQVDPSDPSDQALGFYFITCE